MGTTLQGHSIDEHRAAALAHAKVEAEATYEEMRLEAERPVQKHRAILAIMERETQPNGKPHSYSSAEAIVETDADYSTFLEEQRAHKRHVILTRAKAWAARSIVAEGIALIGRNAL